METTPQPNETSGAGTDDTANLLSEFDKSSAPRPGAGEPTPQPTEPKPEIPMPFEARLRAKMAERDRQFAERTKPQATAPSEQDRSLAQRLEAAESEIAGLRNERAAERQDAVNRADSEAMFNQAAELINKIVPHIPRDYAETWIRNQVRLDPDLALAWSTRNDGEAQHREFRRQVNKALKSFDRYLRSLPDPEATADRAILAAAVRGASGAPPPPAAPNFNKMSDAEFSASVEKQYGYRPKLD